jgi:hypothetical protein
MREMMIVERFSAIPGCRFAHPGYLLLRFRSLNHIDITVRPRPEERAPKSGLPDFGIHWCRNRQQPISMRASRRTATGEIVLTAILRDAVLRTAPQDKVRRIKFHPYDMIGFTESIHYSAILAEPSLVGVSGVTPVRWRARVSRPVASQSPATVRRAKVSQVSVQSPSV